MEQILPPEICLNIVKYMNLDDILKSFLYLNGFKNFINITTLDSMIEEKLSIYRIGINKKQLLLNNKEKLYRFLKHINNVSLNISPFIACDIANMDDNQYHKFDYLSENGINYLLITKWLDTASNNFDKYQLDILIDIYKFIEKNCTNELFICYDTIIKIAQSFNYKQIQIFYYLYQNGFKENIAYNIINIININNSININDVILLNKEGCPDYLICPVLTHITNRQQFIDKIKSGMEPLDAYKSIIN